MAVQRDSGVGEGKQVSDVTPWLRGEAGQACKERWTMVTPPMPPFFRAAR